MSVVSLLRVMTLRDAEAITLEAGRVPSLRRRGQVEALSIPALDATMLDEFAQPLVAGRSLDDGPLMVAFKDDDGASYPVTIERGANGLRIVGRQAAIAKAAPPPAPPTVARPIALVPRAASVSASASASASASWLTTVIVALRRAAPGPGRSDSIGVA